MKVEKAEKKEEDIVKINFTLKMRSIPIILIPISCSNVGMIFFFFCFVFVLLLDYILKIPLLLTLQMRHQISFVQTFARPQYSEFKKANENITLFIYLLITIQLQIIS